MSELSHLRTVDRSNPAVKDEQIAAFMRIKQQDTADLSQRRNVRRWFQDHVNAVHSDEQDYIEHVKDLITLSPKPQTSMDRFCARFAFVQWLFWRRATKSPAYESGILICNDETMQWFADSIIICLGLTMLFGPMWWLNWVTDDVDRLAIITCFVFVFAMGLRAISRPKPFEVLAGTAAYAAVLMVFIQKQV